MSNFLKVALENASHKWDAFFQDYYLMLDFGIIFIECKYYLMYFF